MRGLLYIIAVVLVIGWIFGVFYAHNTSSLIHALLVIAVIAVVLGIIKRA